MQMLQRLQLKRQMYRHPLQNHCLLDVRWIMGMVLEILARHLVVALILMQSQMDMMIAKEHILDKTGISAVHQINYGRKS